MSDEEQGGGGQEGQVNLATLPINGAPMREDVTGLAGKFIDDIVLSMESEGIFKSMGVQADKTYALFGKPGTGKTMAIKALNNERNQTFRLKAMTGNPDELSVGDLDLLVFEYSLGRYGTAYINRGSRMVQSFFDKAGVYAGFGKKVLIVCDECDAILGARGNGMQRHGEDTKVLETIMKNLQIVHDTENMYAVLMSNLPEACDDAALRAGRIDKKYLFNLPTLEERTAAYQLAIDKACERATYKVIRGSNASQLAEVSNGFSYADIVATVNAAVKTRAQEVALDKTPGIMPAAYIRQARLLKAVKVHKDDFITKKERERIGF